MTKEENDIYKLELHQLIKINKKIEVLRVPGGWLYILPGKEPVKVDFSSEFQYSKTKRIVDPEIVIKVVCSYFGLNETLIDKKTREGDFPNARKIIADILTNHSSLRYYEIQNRLGYKSASSLPIARKKLNELLRNNKTIRYQYDEIMKSLKLK